MKHLLIALFTAWLLTACGGTESDAPAANGGSAQTGEQSSGASNGSDSSDGSDDSNGSDSSDGSDGNSQQPDSFRVGAWNIQTFGKSKMGKADVVPVLVDVLRRYDLVVIQEVKDKSETAIHELLALINDYPGPQFELVLSERLGRGRYKEQYAYLYRPDRVALLDQFLYEDGPEPDGDSLAREPLVTWWDLAGFTLSLIPSHVDPDEVPEELDALYQAHAAAVARWNDPDSIVLGDLNADCNYIKDDEWAARPLRSDPQFTWLIGDGIDTTTHDSDCAYDRLIVSGAVSTRVVSGSAMPFDYSEWLGLDKTVTTRVSDHLPVELLLRP